MLYLSHIIVAVILFFGCAQTKLQDEKKDKTPPPTQPISTEPEKTDPQENNSPTPSTYDVVDHKVKVFPVFYLPKDVQVKNSQMNWAKDRINKHVTIAQKRYLELLTTDTFNKLPVEIYNSSDPHSSFKFPASATKVVKDLFAWKNVDRISSPYVFLVFFVRPEGFVPPEDDFLGFGGIFNGGPPGIGGGAVFLDFVDLINDETSPLQSTIQHELGHAFGLNHVDCRGYDMSSDLSMMSYNLSHHAFGLTPSATPGIFDPEDYFVLDKNKDVFPSFKYDPIVHNPSGKELQNIDECYLGVWDSEIGDLSNTKIGYHLYYDSKHVSGSETVYWTYFQGKANCQEMKTANPGINVTCFYNDVEIVQ